jgi:hypothetical protein
MKMHPGIVMVLLFACLAEMQVSYAQETSRVLELSTRSIPLTGSIQFLTDSEATVGPVIEVVRERFVWRDIPATATHFKLKSIIHDSAPIALFPDGNTFVTINPAQPLDPATIGSSELKRLPLTEPAQNMMPVPAGKIGWVYVGSLKADSETAGWSSLYILNASTRLKPDNRSGFHFTKLSDLVASSNELSKSFIADFPLVLRDTNTATAGSAEFPVVRPGQKLLFLEVVRFGKSVKAKVKVL